MEIILAKRKEEASKILKTFAEDPDLQIINGRFGPYISYKKANYRIPKTVAAPAELSYDEVKKLIEAADEAPAKPRRSAAKRKK